MATQDTSTEDEVLETKDDEVETSQEEDEVTTGDEDTSDEGTEDDEGEESEEDDDESETDEDEDPEFKKRFTQFKGDTLEEYTPELEKAYGNAVGEITRLKGKNKENQGKIDAVMAAAAKDPEFAEKLNELMGEEAVKTVTVDPALMQARQDMEDKMEKEYNAFVDLHPELESDPQLAEEVFTLVKEFGDTSRKNGKVMGMEAALTKAWVYLGKDDTKEKVASKAKEIAAKPKANSSVKKTAPKAKSVTDEEISVGKKWGLTPEQLAANKSSK